VNKWAPWFYRFFALAVPQNGFLSTAALSDIKDQHQRQKHHSDFSPWLFIDSLLGGSRNLLQAMFSLYKQHLFLLWVPLSEASGPVLCLQSQASYCCEDPIFFLNQVGQYLDCFVHFIFSAPYSSVVHQKASNAAKPGRIFFNIQDLMARQSSGFMKYYRRPWCPSSLIVDLVSQV
jgi:hypothetical protein